MRIRKNLLLTCCFFVSIFSFSQNRTIDSLYRLINSDKQDSNKVNHYLALTSAFFHISPDSAKSSSGVAVKVAQDLGWKKGVSEAYYYLGVAHNQLGNLSDAENCWKKSLELKESLKDKKGCAKLIGVLGSVYIAKGDYPKALDYCIRALKLCEELNDKAGMPFHLGNIGIVYHYTGDCARAREYYKRTMDLYNELGDKTGVAKQLDNLGAVCLLQKENKQGMEYFAQALKIFEELGNKGQIAHVTGSMGALYIEMAIYSGAGASERSVLLDSALYYCMSSLEVNESLGMKGANAWNLFNIATVYYHQKKYDESANYLKKGLVIAEMIGSLDTQKNILEGLADLCLLKGDHKASLEYFKKFTALKDSMFNQEKHKELTKHEMNYEFAKKEAATKAEQEKKDAVTNAESKKQRTVLWLVSFVLVLVFIFAVFIFRSLRITAKQKLLIQIKNEETEFQKKIIEMKQKDIVDSIHYAKRIQTSLLPTEKYIHRSINKNKKA